MRPTHPPQLVGLLLGQGPREVMCHGDFAQYNVVLRGTEAVALIDFDTAHPGPRAWDIAYALYRWAPLTNADNTDGFGSLVEQVERASLFCTVYGLSAAERAVLPRMIADRLRALVAFMTREADGGRLKFAAGKSLTESS